MIIHVQQLTAEHAAQYRALMLHAYQHEPDAFTSEPGERADLPLSWWGQRIEGPQQSAIAFGAFGDGELVGCVALEFSTRAKTIHKAHLIGMYLLEAWRGQRLGHQLLELALGYAKQRPGIEVVSLTVTEGNTAAIALYEAAGFISFGVEPMAMRTPTGYKAKIHMWRRLNNQ